MKVSENIESLVPYKAGKPIEETKKEFGLETVYKLASNENPAGVSSKVIEALTKALPNLHRYPDAGCVEVKAKLADFFNAKPENITLGNGSNEIIDLLIRVFCQKGQSILTSEFAFIAYKICAQAAGVNIIESAMDQETMSFSIDKIIEDWKEHKSPVVFIANPNNPTGTYISTQEIVKLLEVTKGTDTLIVLDEAYCEYVEASDYPDSLKLQKEYSHLAVLRTFSKAYGIAGLRLGALIASTEVIDYIDRVRNPFNVNSLAQVAVSAVIEDKEYLSRSRNIIITEKQKCYGYLKELGLEFFPSETNFVIFKTKKPCIEVFKELLGMGVILRPLKNYGLDYYMRWSIGQDFENMAAFEALKKVI